MSAVPAVQFSVSLGSVGAGAAATANGSVGGGGGGEATTLALAKEEARVASRKAVRLEQQLADALSALKVAKDEHEALHERLDALRTRNEQLTAVNRRLEAQLADKARYAVAGCSTRRCAPTTAMHWG